jgi:hypothetical protein
MRRMYGYFEYLETVVVYHAKLRYVSRCGAGFSEHLSHE